MDIEMTDYMGKVLDHLTELKSDVGELKSDLSSVKSDIAEIRDYQKQQNGRVFSLSDKFVALDKRVADKSEVDALKIELAKKEENQKTNAKWYAAIWAVVGGLMVTIGKLVLDTFLK